MTDCLPDIEHRWTCTTKDAEETYPVALSCFGMCAQYWEANEQWEAGEYVWPSTPNGFVAECTTPGRSGSKEPRWKNDLTVNQTFTDGSVVWTLRVPTITSGIFPISNPQAFPPAGITVSALVPIENTKIACDYIGGTPGESYDVKFTFDIAGRQRVGRQTVHIAEK